MQTVVQMRLELEREPVVEAAPGIALRTYRGTDDIAAWLELRHRGFAGQRVAVGQWTPADFEREFLAKPWWNAERMWFAEYEGSPVGTVTLAERGRGASAVPVVHWLAVLPRWRRRGVARLLMNALHRDVWAGGGREVFLETHTAWTAAARFYEARGYRPTTAADKSAGY